MGNENINFRQAISSEAQFLSDLAIRSKSFWGYDASFLEECRPVLTVTPEDVRTIPVVVLEERNLIIGFYSLKKIDNENRLDNLWLEPEYIGKGYGKAMFLDSIVKAKEINWDHFRIVAEPYALNFYKKMGAIKLKDIKSRLGVNRYLPLMEIKF